VKMLCKALGLVLSIVILQLCNDKKLRKYVSMAYAHGHYDALNEINRRIK